MASNEELSHHNQENLILQQQMQMLDQHIRQEKELWLRQQARDSDRDGLPDWEERLIGTDPYSKDSDGDGIDDGEEVHRYHTNPNQRDVDFNGTTEQEQILQPYYRPVSQQRSRQQQKDELEL